MSASPLPIYRRRATPLHATRASIASLYCLGPLIAALVCDTPIVLGGLLAALALAGRAGESLRTMTLAARAAAILALLTVIVNALVVREGLTVVARLGELQPFGQIDVTLEASGYVASGSPFWQGSHWGALALLPSLRIGGGAITLGPTLFLGDRKPAMRGMLAFRGEARLARREPHP